MESLWAPSRGILSLWHLQTVKLGDCARHCFLRTCVQSWGSFLTSRFTHGVYNSESKPVLLIREITRQAEVSSINHWEETWNSKRKRPHKLTEDHPRFHFGKNSCYGCESDSLQLPQNRFLTLTLRMLRPQQKTNLYHLDHSNQCDPGHIT